MRSLACAYYQGEEVGGLDTFITGTLEMIVV